MRSTTRQRFARAILVTSVLSSPVALWAAEPSKQVRDVEYAQRGDQKLLADVYVPEGDGPFPTVLLIHGGAWRSGNKSQLSFVANRLAESGYAVVAINYRLAPKHKFPAQIEDCKTALRWIREHAGDHKIDPDRIAAWGYSAGGHLACMLGTTDSSAGLEGSDATDSSPTTRVQAVIAGGAPCDFRDAPEDSPGLAFWLDGTRREKPATYELASPAKFVSSDDPPVFFYHGDADELVPLAGAKQMMESLEKAGVATEIFVIPGAKHVPAALNGDAASQAISFLDRHLKRSTQNKAPDAPAR